MPNDRGSSQSPAQGASSGAADELAGASPEERIFGEALALPPAERAGHVLRAARGDRTLAGRVLDLLAAHATAGSFLETPAVRPAATAAAAELREGPGTVIGPYELVAELGEGGFGVVYRARQLEPVRREVALKIIKLGMDTRQVIARFEAERQALAVLDHPHIARVLDAGATATGRPYFVMELVEGVDIARYCDERRLDPSARLRLFMDVCGALQHAHQRGLIHRDLKPTNILVTHRDGVHVPKVIDFGIAKATKQRLTERTVFTELGQFIGTPVYMSPEQAEHGDADVDTRSDIYSLGVVLYELLAGRPPFEAKELRDRGLAEIQAFIKQHEPVPPSGRVTKLGTDETTVALARGLSPGHLAPTLRGDLDWIVLKALEKEPDRRYESASAFAADIGRYLDNLPVLASPPSALYRAQKFVRRHRLAVGAGAVVVAALLGGVALMLVGFVEARRNAALARAQADLLADVLLANSADRETRLAVSGDGLRARFVAAFGEDHPGFAGILRFDAERLQSEGRATEALAAYARALDEVARVHGATSRDHTLLLAQLGLLQSAQKLDAEARASLQAALDAEVAAFGRRTPRLNPARQGLAEVLLRGPERAREADIDAAMALCREALDVLRAEAPDDGPRRLQAAIYYLQRASNSGRDAELGPVWVEAVELVDALHPAGTPLRGDVRIQLATWNRTTKVFDEPTVERRVREALAEYGEGATPAAANRAIARALLVELLLEHGDAVDVAEALEQSAKSVGDVRTAAGQSQALADALETHAERLETHGRSARAIEALLEAIQVRRAVVGPGADVRRQKDALDRLAQALVLDTRLENLHPDFLVGLEAVQLLQRESDGVGADMYAKLHDALTLRLGNPLPAINRMGGIFGTRPAKEEKNPYSLALAALGLSTTGNLERSQALLNEAVELAKRPEYTNDRRTQEFVAFVRKALATQD